MAILLQNATKVYNKMHQIIYYIMRQLYYKFVNFIAICVSTNSLENEVSKGVWKTI